MGKNIVPEPSLTAADGAQTNKLTLKERFFGRVPVAVAKSLREEPESWTHDAELMGRPHRLTHRSGVTLWVANGSYGMEVLSGRYGRTVWGDVTMLSTLHLSPGHHYLRRAADQWLRERRRKPDLVGEVLTSLRAESR